MKTAILVDGGFYRKRAAYLWGKKDPERRKAELIAYCSAHLKHEQRYDDRRDCTGFFIMAALPSQKLCTILC